MDKSDFGFKLRELYSNFDKIISLNEYSLNVIDELMNLKADILLFPDIGMNPFTNTMASV